MDEKMTELPAYQSSLRRYALSLVGDTDTADDLVQDCLLRAIEHVGNGGRVDNLKSYLFAILRNLHVDQVRAVNRSILVLSLNDMEDVPDAVPGPLQLVEAGQMMRLLTSLPKDQFYVIMLIGFQQLTYKDAAKVLNVPIGTIMSRLCRGRQALQHPFKRHFRAGVRGSKHVHAAQHSVSASCH